MCLFVCGGWGLGCGWGLDAPAQLSATILWSRVTCFFFITICILLKKQECLSTFSPPNNGDYQHFGHQTVVIINILAVRVNSISLSLTLIEPRMKSSMWSWPSEGETWGWSLGQYRCLVWEYGAAESEFCSKSSTNHLWPSEPISWTKKNIGPDY